MPKYYCDYCDAVLQHDSESGRRTHNQGRKHKDNVRQWYTNWVMENPDDALRYGALPHMFPGILSPPICLPGMMPSMMPSMMGPGPMNPMRFMPPMGPMMPPMGLVPGMMGPPPMGGFPPFNPGNNNSHLPAPPGFNGPPGVNNFSQMNSVPVSAGGSNNPFPNINMPPMNAMPGLKTPIGIPGSMQGVNPPTLNRSSESNALAMSK